MTIDNFMLFRCAVACMVSESPHVTASALRGYGLPWLYFRARAVVAHDRALREVDRQPVRQEASK